MVKIQIYFFVSYVSSDSKHLLFKSSKNYGGVWGPSCMTLNGIKLENYSTFIEKIPYMKKVHVIME